MDNHHKANYAIGIVGLVISTLIVLALMKGYVHQEVVREIHSFGFGEAAPLCTVGVDCTAK